MQDWRLLRDFADNGSEAAFGQLTKKYMDLVYGTCRREIGDPVLAEDATQAVFLILAKKAGAFRRGTTLGSWLFQTALLTSRNALKQERRHKMREQRIVQEMVSSETQAEQEWILAEPRLHEALAALPGSEREAILLRFFTGHSLPEVGRALDISEDAARMRVNRAIEKMRLWFTRHGIALSGAGLALALEQAVCPAPAHCAAALAKIPFAALGNIPAAGVAHALSSMGANAQTIAQGELRTMTLLKLKAVAAGVAIAITGAAITTGVVRSKAANTKSAARSSPSAQLRPVVAVAVPDPSGARATLDQMYAAYDALGSFECDVDLTSVVSSPWGTSLVDEIISHYEIEKPDKIRFSRLDKLMGGRTEDVHEVSDGTFLYFQSTEFHANPSLYAKLSLGKDPVGLRGYTGLFESFGSMHQSRGGEDNVAGMPFIALGDHYKFEVTGKPSKIYTMGPPSTVDGVPVDTVIVPKIYNDFPRGEEQTFTFSIGKQDRLLHKVVITYPVGNNNSYTDTYTCKNIKINPVFSGANFTFTPPAGSREVSDVDMLYPSQAEMNKP